MALFGKRIPPPPPAAKEPEAPPAAAMTRDDLAAAVATATSATRQELEVKIAELRGQLDESRRTPSAVAPVVTAPARPVVTDEEIEAAIANGTGGAARIRQLIDSQVRGLEESVTRQISEITNRGLSSIGHVTREVVLKQLPQYKKYQKEIDAKIAALPPAAQADAEVLKIVHDSVVGAHIGEIEREAHEAALRGATEPADDKAPRKTANAPGAGGRGDSKAVPTIDEYSEGGSGALKDKDRRSGVKDQDSFAQSLGYESWAHYMQVEEDTRAEAEKMGITLR